jgi:isoquinoline 1-oxidoreductase beta subunit
MTTALKSKITFANGGAVEANFTDYPLISINEMPEVVPIIVASDRPPQGCGEVVLAPLAPAIAQALHATGREIATMPLPADAFRLS